MDGSECRHQRLSEPPLGHADLSAALGVEDGQVSGSWSRGIPGQSLASQSLQSFCHAVMSEKTCQTLPLDCDDARAKCPCCGSSLRLVLKWKSEGVQFELQPLDAKAGDDHVSQQNNSLMNIVSVTSAESRLKELKQLETAKFFSQTDPQAHARNHDLEDESNDANVDDSGSSSPSAHSVPRSFSGSGCVSHADPAALQQTPASCRKQADSHAHPPLPHRSSLSGADVDSFRGQSQSSLPRYKCEVNGE